MALAHVFGCHLTLLVLLVLLLGAFAVFATHPVLVATLFARLRALLVLFAPLFLLFVAPFVAVRRLRPGRAAGSETKRQRCNAYDGPHVSSPPKIRRAGTSVHSKAAQQQCGPPPRKARKG
jgi:hypothetical protein